MANEQQEGPPPIWRQAPPVEFKPSGDSKISQGILIAARQSAAFEIAAGLLGHAIACRAVDILIDYSAQGAALRYQIDGMWEQLPGMDRLTGDAMLVVLKQLTLLNPADRRNRQDGEVELKCPLGKMRCKLTTQGVPTGERVLIHFEPFKLPYSNLADLGMREKMVESLREALNAGGGCVLFSAPKGQGLTTIWNVGLQAADKFIRDFQMIEDRANPEPEIINVSVNHFNSVEGPAASDVLRSLILREPDVFVLPDLIDDDIIETLKDQLGKRSDSHVITRIVANDCIDAVLKLTSKHRKSAKSLLSMLTCVTGQALVRRLCDACKQGFQPPPQLLQKLGIPPGRINMLYRQYVPPTEPQLDEKGQPIQIPPCPQCQGRGYFGRVGIFELLMMTAEIREAFGKTSDPAKLRQVIRGTGQRSLQEEAVLTVARGLTSLEEVRRAFTPAQK